MSLTLKENAKSGEFEIAPIGNHLAIAYQMVDLGEQYSAAYDKWQPKVRIGWELCNEQMADGRPFMVASTYTMSFNEKAILRRDLESWRGRPFTEEELSGFDLKNVLGKSCMVNLVHNTAGNGKTYANVKSVAAVPKGMALCEQVNENMVFEFGDQGFDMDKFLALPTWLQEQIQKSRTYEVLNRENGANQERDDVGFKDDFGDADIPF
jgi:hypothetical protein